MFCTFALSNHNKQNTIDMTNLSTPQPNKYIAQIFAAYKDFQNQRKSFDINNYVEFQKVFIGSFNNDTHEFININGEVTLPLYKAANKTICICPHQETEYTFSMRYWFGECRSNSTFGLSQTQAKNLFFLLKYLDKNAHSSINFYLLSYTTEEQVAGLYKVLGESRFFKKTEKGLSFMNIEHLFMFSNFLNIAIKNQKGQTTLGLALQNAAKTKIKQALQDLTLDKAS
jgi:hypothetical protein